MILIGIAMIFNGLDLVTGILGAVRNGGKLQSSKLRDGLFKKVGFVCCYALGVALNYAEMYFELPFAKDLLPIICGYDFSSIIEFIFTHKFHYLSTIIIPYFYDIIMV